ncbi:hypothetical protein NVP2275O_283 [Vibrio phage 2.275.O._10N.286.54.E11]|nr:hypothetical protein NVP2275O_283 [Vibrio phage 2.275.O._10N.286.54.E11]
MKLLIDEYAESVITELEESLADTTQKIGDQTAANELQKKLKKAKPQSAKKPREQKIGAFSPFSADTRG